MNRIATAAITIMLVVSLGTFPSSAQEDPWLVDIPTSPVRLKPERRTLILLHNSSIHEIIEIVLGVVRRTEGGIDVDARRTRVELKQPLGSNVMFNIGSSELVDDIEYAVKNHGKLAVVFVRFSDGSVWSLKGACE
jgi:hypothetical protein